MDRARGDAAGDQPNRGAACLDPERMAAYIDGRLGAGAMRETEEHLADCDDCRELATGTAKIVMSLKADRGHPRGREWWIVVGTLGVAAAAVLLLVLPAILVDRPQPSPVAPTLAAAVGPWRPIEARLSGGFRYGPLISATRSGNGGTASRPEIVIAVARIEQALARKRNSETLTAFGAAQLVVGRVDSAIVALEEARELAPREAAVWIDLAAAHLEKAGRVPADAAAAHVSKALDAATRATQLAPDVPEAWFNLAIAQQRHGSEGDAAVSWRQFFTVERDAAWIEEGQRYLSDLGRPDLDRW